MDSPYRNARTPLQERRAALRRELDQTDARITALAHESVRRDAIAAELRQIDTALRKNDARRQLPLLRSVAVATPCPAKWDDMVGDDRTRFCGSCAKSVYDLSAMTADEAEAFLRATFGQHVCVRFFRRADGTLLTRDCEVGASRRRKQRLAMAALAVTASATAALHLTERPTQVSMEHSLGERLLPAPPVPATDPRLEEGIGKLREGHTMGALPPRGPNVKPGAKGRAREVIGCPPGDPLCSE